MDSIGHPEPKEAPETPWLTPAQVMNFEGVSRREVYRRMEPGDAHFLLSKDREDGKPGRLINPRSMSPDAQDRWRKDELRKAARPATEAAQLGLLPQTEIDSKIAALSLSRSETDVVLRRYRIVDLCLNHNWKAEGYASKGAFMAALAARNGTSKRSIERWVWAWKQGENLLDLVNERPGPAPGRGTVLDADMRAHLIACWRIKKLALRQCYSSLVKYLETKQKSPGCRVDHFYPIPSRTTVERFIRSLSALDDAERQGADAFKAAVGCIDRTYDDLRSLDRVECDEWKYNLFAYDPEHPRRVYRYWLLLFLDIRSIYPLVWKIVRGSDNDTRHGISEEDEIELIEKLIREYGVPRVLSTDRGRFRGNTWGGQPAGKNRDAQFERADGILDNLGITYNRPRESNPRGMRVHPLFLYLSNQCQGLSGYIGRNTVERKSTRGDFEKAEHLEWAAGRRGVKSPILSLTELSARTEEWIESWRDHPSEGTDMRGLSPRAVFVHNMPPEGFRRISDEQLALHTAEHFGVLVGKGGIIQLRDGKRYSDPQLLLIQGEHREVARPRHDHEQIYVLPSAKGEEPIIAKRRGRVGVDDPDELARQMELQNRLRKLAGEFVKPLDYDPGSQYLAPAPQPEAPKAAQVIHPSEFIAAQEAPTPAPQREIGSVEYLMEHDRYKRRVKVMDFADLEP